LFKLLLGLRVGRFIHWKEFCISNTVYIIFGVHEELCEKKKHCTKNVSGASKGSFYRNCAGF